MTFGENFIWGAAAASFQLEGAYNEDGKGLNIWDVTARDGHIKHNETGNISTDHYHRMKQDVALMKALGLKAYRFSISWARVLPEGTGEVNSKGLKFYSDLVDELLGAGIEPLVTIFHWDYPYALECKGGWKNSESSEWFLEYTKVIVDALSDRVRYWMTFNEPQCSLGVGYCEGKFAPFQKLSTPELIKMGANMLLAHGKAVKYIRENSKLGKPQISMAPYASVFRPVNDSEEAIDEAYEMSFRCDGPHFPFTMSYWSDPIYLGKYPDEFVNKYKELIPEFTSEEWAMISAPLDFYGVNVYYLAGRAEGENGYSDIWYQGRAHTALNWPVTPEALYWAPKFLYRRYKLPVMITENGMSEHDWVSLDGKVHDSYRIDYTNRYLRELMRVSEEVPVIGYMHWSVMDNFEWAEGYDERFGLIYIDYQTQERIIKDSGFWYKNVIKTNGKSLYDEGDLKKGIIFDMDGTIWDSSENVARSWDIKVKEFGFKEHSVTQNDIKSVMGKTMDVIADILFPYAKEGQERNSLRKACEEYENEYLREHGGTLYPEVIETLTKLKAMGYNLYIVSNCQAGYIESFLSYFGIDLNSEDPLIKDIECYGNNFLSKGDNIELLTKRNGLDKAVYVGDIQSDYDSTMEAGLPFIHAAYGFGSINAEVPRINTFADLTRVITEVI